MIYFSGFFALVLMGLIVSARSFYKEVIKGSKRLDKPLSRVRDNQVRGLHKGASKVDWYNLELNEEGKIVYYEDSTGFWYKQAFRLDGGLSYHEDSDGNVYKWLTF